MVMAYHHTAWETKSDTYTVNAHTAGKAHEHQNDQSNGWFVCCCHAALQPSLRGRDDSVAEDVTQQDWRSQTVGLALVLHLCELKGHPGLLSMHSWKYFCLMFDAQTSLLIIQRVTFHISMCNCTLACSLATWRLEIGEKHNNTQFKDAIHENFSWLHYKISKKYRQNVMK